MNDSVDSICVLLWLIFLFGGCTYLVFWKGASGAWYLLAMMLGSGMNRKKKESDE